MSSVSRGVTRLSRGSGVVCVTDMSRTLGGFRRVSRLSRTYLRASRNNECQSVPKSKDGMNQHKTMELTRDTRDIQPNLNGAN